MKTTPKRTPITAERTTTEVPTWNRHYANIPMHYAENFEGCKNAYFQMFFSFYIYFFLIFTQSIDRGDTLEPPQ